MAGVEGGRPTAQRLPGVVALAVSALATCSLAACGSSYVAPTAASLTRAGRADQAAYRQGAATVSYRSALSLDPSYVPALLGLAELAERSVPVEAVALADQAVSLAPGDAAAHRLLGTILISMGETQAGRAQLRIAARLGRRAPH